MYFKIVKGNSKMDTNNSASTVASANDVNSNNLDVTFSKNSQSAARNG